MSNPVSTGCTLPRNVINSCALTAAILALFLWSSMAHSYGYQHCKNRTLRFDRQWTNMYLSTTSFPIGSVWDARLQNAMWRWNNVKGANFKFYVGRDTDGDHREGNGKNEVYFDNSIGESTLAVTRYRTHCYWLFGWHYGWDESDIGFNDVAWNTGSIDYDSLHNTVSFEGVALHEFGHALGLGHEDRQMATMNSIYPNSGSVGHHKTWDVLPDDRAGVRFIYPDSTTETDIAGSAFRRTGAGTSGLVISTTNASRGGTALVEFTFHNMSTSSQNFNIGFYLSTNSYISTFDRLLGTNTGASAPPGASGTFTRTVNIPTNVNPGQYWLGFIVDYDSRVAESVEANNYMEMPRRVQIN